MKTNTILFLIITFVFTSCSKSVDYTPQFIKETSGRYLFSPDETIEVFYKDKDLFLNWRGKENIEPLVLNDSVYFVKEMNKKIQFVKSSNSNKYAIIEVLKDDLLKKPRRVSYEKMADSINVPSAYLKNKQYDKALEGYLAIQKEDSNSVYVKEYIFNRYGYKFMNDENYEDAIEIFKLNTILYPTSDNVYDSLADAYARSGDSLKAYENYKKALQFNTGNRMAKRFMKAYNKK